MKKRSSQKSNKVYSSTSASSRRPERAADSPSSASRRSNQTSQSNPRGSRPSEDENRYRSRTTEGRDYGYDADADESTYREEDALAKKRYHQPTQKRRSSARRETS